MSAANSTSSDMARDSGQSGPSLEHRGRGGPGLRDGPGCLEAPSVTATRRVGRSGVRATDRACRQGPNPLSL